MYTNKNVSFIERTPFLRRGGAMSSPKQTTSHLMMIAPVAFACNPETLEDNSFQNESVAGHNPQHEARREFEEMCVQLREHGVDLLVFEDTLEPHTPDSIFPNNWISFHENGDLVLYPMKAENRRLERRTDIVDAIDRQFVVKNKIDLTSFEQEGIFLEGTGSMVLDRKNKIAYACLSPRTNIQVLSAFLQNTGFEAVYFYANDDSGTPIYHTNVMLAIGEHFAVICAESIRDVEQRRMVIEGLVSSGHDIIEITPDQMNCFAGNMLEVESSDGQRLIVMSDAAFSSLSAAQLEKLSAFGTVLHQDLTNIEKYGGGSARCMLAEIFLPVRDEK